jgi:hypothetical protein
MARVRIPTSPAAIRRLLECRRSGAHAREMHSLSKPVQIVCSKVDTGNTVSPYITRRSRARQICRPQNVRTVAPLPSAPVAPRRHGGAASGAVISAPWESAWRALAGAYALTLTPTLRAPRPWPRRQVEGPASRGRVGTPTRDVGAPTRATTIPPGALAPHRHGVCIDCAGLGYGSRRSR